MKTFIRTSNALLIFVLTVILFWAIYLQFGAEGPPCPYCWLQRIGMIGVATALMMNLRFGIHLKAYAIALFFAFTGGAVALRQISFFVCPSFPDPGPPILGLSLYTWSFIIFCCSAIAIFIFLFFFDGDQEKPKRMNVFEKFVFFALILVTVADAGLLYNQYGIGSTKQPSPKKLKTAPNTPPQKAEPVS